MQRVNRLVSHLSPSPCAGKFHDPNSDAVSLDAAQLFSVQGKVAVVTGGSKGIGFMIARGLIQNGAKVYIVSRKAKACDAAANELNTLSGGVAVPLPADLATEAGCIQLANELSKREERIHILINNAGATWGAPLEEYPDKAWEKVMNLNVRSVFNLTKLLLPLLSTAGSQGGVGDPARVVNISSVDGVRAQQTFGPTASFAYTVSKGAVNHLTHALCRALSSHNVSVNAIAPGMVPSNMTKFVMQNEAGREMMEQSNPLKRVGRTADMAGAALFLCSAAGSWVNGVIIPVDGGGVVHDSGLGH